jgi:hypothetical protein
VRTGASVRQATVPLPAVFSITFDPETQFAAAWPGAWPTPGWRTPAPRPARPRPGGPTPGSPIPGSQRTPRW